MRCELNRRVTGFRYQKDYVGAWKTMLGIEGL